MLIFFINCNTALSIAAGVPYHVRVYAENINGRGSYCITTDFGDQLSTYSTCIKLSTSYSTFSFSSP